MTMPVDDHTPEAHAVIAVELGECILGHRRHGDRVELRVDVAGRILAMARNLDAVKAQIGEALRPLVAYLAGPPRRKWWQR